MQQLQAQNQLKRLLIVDSDLDSKDLMIKNLARVFDITLIDNVTDAMDYGEGQIPDIILIDLDMPQVDGFELLGQLDSHPILCDVPVISMIDSKDEKFSRRAYRAGTSGMIYKPFNVSQLAKDIEGVLKRTSTAITSSNKRISYYVEFSEKAKNKKIQKLIAEQDFSSEPLVLLSWSRGEDLMEEIDQGEELIKSTNLFYLEIKPSLISKFPYLLDVTPVVHEIKQFLEQNTRKFHLVFEEPGHLLNLEQKEKSISQAFNLAQVLHSEFNRVSYVNSRPEGHKEVKFQNKVGSILTGVKN